MKKHADKAIRELLIVPYGIETAVELEKAYLEGAF